MDVNNMLDGMEVSGEELDRIYENAVMVQQSYPMLLPGTAPRDLVLAFDTLRLIAEIWGVYDRLGIRGNTKYRARVGKNNEGTHINPDFKGYDDGC